MPAQSLAKLSVRMFDETSPVSIRRDGHPRASMTERSVYQSQRLSPASAFAALTLAAAAFSSFQYLGSAAPHHKQQRQLTVITLADLVKPPLPPAPAPRPVKPTAAMPPIRAAIVAPPPRVMTPTLPPAMALTTVPAPSSPAPAMVEQPAAQAVQAAPPAASTTAEAGDLSSRMISATPPTYPLESRRLHEQGTVVLAVLLSIEGRVEHISVAKSSGYPRLDRAASGAVRHWRWSPTVQGGEPVLVRGNVVIPFVLRT